MKSLDDLEAYSAAMELGRLTYDAVSAWSYFDKDTLGKQMVRSADSVAANIAEGYGRFTFPERIRFCLFARGSLFEFRVQQRKALERGLVDGETGLKLEALAGNVAAASTVTSDTFEKWSVEARPNLPPNPQSPIPNHSKGSNAGAPSAAPSPVVPFWGSTGVGLPI